MARLTPHTRSVDRDGDGRRSDGSPTKVQKGRVRRSIWIAIAVSLAVALLIGFLTSQWYLHPASDPPSEADAIVMLAGGRGERLDLAIKLADDGFAPVVVIMNGTNWSKGREVCAMQTSSYEVLCPVDPQNTRGEARIVGRLAEELGWDSILLVTSDYHMHRASTLVGRCFDGAVTRQVATNDFDTSRLLDALASEWAGTLHSWVVSHC